MPMAAAREFSVPGRLRSLLYAARGLRTLLVSQQNAWIHATATLLVVAAGFHLGIERQDWLALILAMVSVWAAEALNTALEFLCDAASSDFHPLVEKAKDVAAAAVLICTLGALLVGALVFAPHLLHP
jgi:diacylglycerol kinase